MKKRFPSQTIMWQQDFRRMPHPRRASIKKSSALLWKMCALFTCWLGGAYYFVSRSQSRTRIRSSSNRLPVSEDVAKLKNGQPLLRRHDDENGYLILRMIISSKAGGALQKYLIKIRVTTQRKAYGSQVFICTPKQYIVDKSKERTYL